MKTPRTLGALIVTFAIAVFPASSIAQYAAQPAPQAKDFFPVTEPMTAEKSADIDALLSATHYKDYWPGVIRQLNRGQIEHLRAQSLQTLSAHPELTEAQKQEYREFVDANLATLAEQVDAVALGMDMPKIIQFVKNSFYGKYFTDAEIRALTEIFSKPVMQKSFALQSRAVEEAQHSNMDEVRAKLLTHAEIDEMGQISHIPVVQKLAALTPILSNDVKPVVIKATDMGALESQSKVYLAKTDAKLKSFAQVAP